MKKELLYHLNAAMLNPFTFFTKERRTNKREKRKKKDGRRKHNEICDGVAGIIRELWWVFGRRVKEGVCSRIEGREGASLDTSRKEHNEGEAGVVRELPWFFGRRVREGVSSRIEGREGASLDTSRKEHNEGEAGVIRELPWFFVRKGSSMDTSRETFSDIWFSHFSVVPLFKVLLPILLWEKRGGEDDESSW